MFTRLESIPELHSQVIKMRRESWEPGGSGFGPVSDNLSRRVQAAVHSDLAI